MAQRKGGAVAKAERQTPTVNEARADQMLERVMKAPALLDKDKIVDAERRASLRDWPRRAMWHVLAMPGKEIIEKVRSDRDTAIAFAGLLNAVSEYEANQKALGEFMGELQYRLLVALACREDMSAVMAEADRPKQDGVSEDDLLALLYETGGRA